MKDKSGKLREVLVQKDDGIRKGTSLATLAKLKPAFKKTGSTTAGNSSQVTDGAAAVMLARRSYAEKLGLPIYARLVSSAVEGVPPHIMGIGPAVAIPSALKKAGLAIADIDIFEINEAFASQATYCVKKLGIDTKKLNPKGGAIAIGHPLGMTGARMVGTLLSELRRTDRRFGVVSMCIGTGMGAAAVFELEKPGPNYSAYRSVNPQNNKLAKAFPFDSEKQISEKIERAWTGFKQWSGLTQEQRNKKLEKLADLMDEKQEQLAQVLTSEMGKPVAQAMMEIDFASQLVRHAAENAAEAMKPIPADTGLKKSVTVFQPIGPVYSIQPWNFPVSTLIHTNIQALAIGNSILVKPAPSCAQTALFIEDLCKQAGLTSGES